ncbi:MAG: hypothetical protein AB8B79_00420 [Granulosicoccus sp.]
MSAEAATTLWMPWASIKGCAKPLLLGNVVVAGASRTYAARTKRTCTAPDTARTGRTVAGHFLICYWLIPSVPIYTGVGYALHVRFLTLSVT